MQGQYADVFFVKQCLFGSDRMFLYLQISNWLYYAPKCGLAFWLYDISDFRFMMMRAENFIILRRKPVEVGVVMVCFLYVVPDECCL